MKISELIDTLQKIKNVYGEIDVFTGISHEAPNASMKITVFNFSHDDSNEQKESSAWVSIR